ncbi:MAG TPA: SlyX family protein [Porticoccus sp.]|nr:SlyX family protein [Porticoccus sp.]
MADNDEMDWVKQQFIDLQSQLAFQEDTIQALNEVVTRQQQQINNLDELCRNQKSQMELMNSEMGKEALDEKPPHY